MLIVAHGTASPRGSQTTRDLVHQVALARPGVAVGLCFLDVAEPTLASALEHTTVATVVLPLLLSTGFHTLVDIPAAIAARIAMTPEGAGAARLALAVATHLGPDEALVDILLDRLAEVRHRPAASTALVAAGSTREQAAAELHRTGQLLATRLGRPVSVHTVDDQLPKHLAALAAPVEVVPYLLAEGRFMDSLRAAAPDSAMVAAPIGVHPALISLLWSRYDEASTALG
ncbi:MAG: hypothetical protein M3O28_08030 [Actinomycetota bacterium]|nr:hypothetical protein [Actinomycetota bacterium]